MTDGSFVITSGRLLRERPNLRRDAKFLLDPQGEGEGRGFTACQKLVGVGLADANALQVGCLDQKCVHTPESMLFPYFMTSEKVCWERNDRSYQNAQNMGMEYNHLRAWRKFRNLTLDEVAEAIGSTKATVQQLEVGKMTLSHKWLIKIAPVLKTTPGMLLDHDPNELPTSVLETWATIPEADQPKAMEMLKVFARTGTAG